eukprot:SAG31_NODE_780_length_12148_cov_7.369295_4_plen_648_part_00
MSAIWPHMALAVLCVAEASAAAAHRAHAGVGSSERSRRAAFTSGPAVVPHHVALRGETRQAVNVVDYGATGSGSCLVTEGSNEVAQPYGACSGRNDDHAGIQAAVHAAISQRRPLFFPPGVYVVNSTVVVNASGLLIYGSFWQDTVLAAGPGCKGADAVLLYPTSQHGEHGWNEVSSLSVNANGFATNGIQALTMTRSRFVGIGVFRAQAGLRLARGWELHIEDSYIGCAGGGNEVGILATAAINGLSVINNQFEGDHVGIAVNDGSNVLLQGNVIEGMGGAGIILNSVAGAVVSANYFEDNNWQQDGEEHAGVPNFWFDHAEGKNFTMCADIVLNGIPNHCSAAPWICNSSGGVLLISSKAFMWELSSAYPSYGVSVTGNFFAPTNLIQQPKCADRYSAVAAVAVDGLSLTANDCAPCVGNDSLLLSGTNYVSWMARKVDASANSRWSRMLRLQDNGYNGADMAYHTWRFDSVAARNYGIIDPLKWSSTGAPLLAPPDTTRPICIAHCKGSMSNYPPTYRWNTSSTGNGSALVVFEEKLQIARRLANNTLYAAIEVQALTVDTGFAIFLDGGSGTWQQSSHEAFSVTESRVVSFQISTGASGVVRAALGLFWAAKTPPSTTHPLSVELLGPVVVSPVGTPYNELFT